MNRGDGSALDFSRRASRLEVSPTVATAQRASALKASGVYVFDFSVGEPDQPTPAHITNAAVTALEAGQTKYTPAAGLPELRAAVADPPPLQVPAEDRPARCRDSGHQDPKPLE